jgi:hypothetical protein
MSRHLLLVPASRVLRPCAWWSFGRQVTKVPGPKAGRPWDARLASGQLVGTAYSAGRIFVPLTIGLSILVACMQMAWLVKENPVYLRMTKCFGTLF